MQGTDDDDEWSSHVLRMHVLLRNILHRRLPDQVVYVLCWCGGFVRAADLGKSSHE